MSSIWLCFHGFILNNSPGRSIPFVAAKCAGPFGSILTPNTVNHGKCILSSVSDWNVKATPLFRNK
ncbi:hypothetical protein X975_23413, partial [Stegodyphus mimosarum]